MSSPSKIADIEAQIEACEAGRTNVITCPYCAGKNWKPEGAQSPALCCRLFAAAALAIIERQAVEEQKRIAERVSCN